MTRFERQFWYFFAPFGVWWCSDGCVVLFNRARQPIIAFNADREIYVPASARLDERKRQDWERDKGSAEKSVEYREWEQEHRFYGKRNCPWGEGRASGETRVRILSALADFLEGKTPVRGSKK